MLKLKWRKNEFGQEQRALYVNELCVGEIHDHRHAKTPIDKSWRSWKLDCVEGNRLSLHATPEEAREALEIWAKTQLEID